jgi:hypothetical protein
MMPSKQIEGDKVHQLSSAPSTPMGTIVRSSKEDTKAKINQRYFPSGNQQHKLVEQANDNTPSSESSLAKYSEHFDGDGSPPASLSKSTASPRRKIETSGTIKSSVIKLHTNETQIIDVEKEILATPKSVSTHRSRIDDILGIGLSSECDINPDVKYTSTVKRIKSSDSDVTSATKALPSAQLYCNNRYNQRNDITRPLDDQDHSVHSLQNKSSAKYVKPNMVQHHLSQLQQRPNYVFDEPEPVQSFEQQQESSAMLKSKVFGSNNSNHNTHNSIYHISSTSSDIFDVDDVVLVIDDNDNSYYMTKNHSLPGHRTNQNCDSSAKYRTSTKMCDYDQRDDDIICYDDEEDKEIIFYVSQSAHDEF